jgi:hypothetical protein
MTKLELKPQYLLPALFFLVVAGYFTYQARFLILGPQITITSPLDGSSVESSVISIEGTASNIAWISLNGRQIFTNEKGVWSEKLLVSSGLSIMTVQARDRFGRETSKRVRIVLN